MIDGDLDYPMPPANRRIYRVFVFVSSCPLLPAKHRHICAWVEQTRWVHVKLTSAGMMARGDRADLLVITPS